VETEQESLPQRKGRFFLIKRKLIKDTFLSYKREREFFITLNMVPPVFTGIIISAI
jgi:hypothetical protein